MTTSSVAASRHENVISQPSLTRSSGLAYHVRSTLPLHSASNTRSTYPELSVSTSSDNQCQTHRAGSRSRLRLPRACSVVLSPSELVEIRAAQRTFEGAYIRTSLSQFSFALIVLKIFTSEFYSIGMYHPRTPAVPCVASQLWVAGFYGGGLLIGE